MKNRDESVESNHNPNWPYIPQHPCRILIIGGSGSSKTNVLLNLIKHQRPDIDKIYLYIKDPLKSKCQLLINGRERAGIKKLKNPKEFIDYSQAIDDALEILEEYNPTKKRIVLIVFDDMIADMEANKKSSPISLVFMSQSYFKVPKTIRLNATHFIVKIPNKRELQQIVSSHSSDI